jgi:hypothetical protein
MIAILLAGDLIPARTFYPYILGKERFGAVDEVERAFEVSSVDVLLIALYPVTRHSRCGGHELKERAIVIPAGHLRRARMSHFRLQIFFPWAAAYQSSHSC